MNSFCLAVAVDHQKYVPNYLKKEKPIVISSINPEYITLKYNLLAPDRSELSVSDYP